MRIRMRYCAPRLSLEGKLSCPSAKLQFQAIRRGMIFEASSPQQQSSRKQTRVRCTLINLTEHLQAKVSIQQRIILAKSNARVIQLDVMKSELKEKQRARPLTTFSSENGGAQNQTPTSVRMSPEQAFSNIARQVNNISGICTLMRTYRLDKVKQLNRLKKNTARGEEKRDAKVCQITWLRRRVGQLSQDKVQLWAWDKFTSRQNCLGSTDSSQLSMLLSLLLSSAVLQGPERLYMTTQGGQEEIVMLPSVRLTPKHQTELLLKLQTRPDSGSDQIYLLPNYPLKVCNICSSISYTLLPAAVCRNTNRLPLSRKASEQMPSLMVMLAMTVCEVRFSTLTGKTGPVSMSARVESLLIGIVLVQSLKLLTAPQQVHVRLKPFATQQMCALEFVYQTIAFVLSGETEI